MIFSGDGDISFPDAFQNTKNPLVLSLHQNQPNPFSFHTTISYDLPHSGKIKLGVFDITGTLVPTPLNVFQDTGNYRIILDGNHLDNGFYLHKLEEGKYERARTRTLLK